MTDATTLLALAERAETATGPDRELDAAIYLALNPHMAPIPGEAGRYFDPKKTNAVTAKKYFLGNGATGFAPRYTASVDAALSLVPEENVFTVATWWADGDDAVRFYADTANRMALQSDDPNCIIYEAKAATPALALVVAALRAQAGEGE